MSSSKLSGLCIAILATDVFDQSELIAPRRLLHHGGAHADVIAPGEKNQIKGWSKGDWVETVPVDVQLKNAIAADYDALLLSGG